MVAGHLWKRSAIFHYTSYRCAVKVLFSCENKFKFNGESMEEILRKLTDKNDKTAYEFAKQLGVESVESDRYLAMIPMFAELLQDKSS